jgi:S-adenosylmethionine:tRNA-ribosyltransferase-isomerase (queuine synthetase)
MVKKIITLPTNDSKIYKQILAFLNFMLNATNQEREVLAELIRLNHEYEALPPEKRAKFILSTDMRKEIRDALGIEEKQFNNIISRLKKKTFLGRPVLNENNVIEEQLMFKPDEEGFKIEINLIQHKAVAPESKKAEKVEPEKEAKEENKPVQKSLAPPANGKDNIIEEPDFEGLLISPPTDD